MSDPGWQATDILASFSRLGAVVVIDPEDRAQVERLHAAMIAADFMDGFDTLQAALREFANPTPPKPEEPTGLGAVVEDVDGVEWVRWHRRTKRPWKHADEVGNYQNYADLAVVKVLSEGVTR